MERYVETTLAPIEVDVKWIDCAANIEACKALRGRNEFWLRILAQNPPALNAGTELLGLTQRGDKPDEIPCINIFYPMVEHFAEKMHTEEVLGAAVAHEIGHMYLGNNREAHSLNGIMSGVWLEREFEEMNLGTLHFTREQGARIRTALSAAITGDRERTRNSEGAGQLRVARSLERAGPLFEQLAPPFVLAVRRVRILNQSTP